MVAAALALAAAATEKAELAATVRQMQQQMDYAAMVSENTQLRLERRAHQGPGPAGGVIAFCGRAPTT